MLFVLAVIHANAADHKASARSPRRESTPIAGRTFFTEIARMPKITYEPIKDDDKLPICPHGEKEITTMRYFEQPGVMALKVSRLFVCPHCLKVLGIGTVGF